jgi:hypothetical protein
MAFRIITGKGMGKKRKTLAVILSMFLLASCKWNGFAVKSSKSKICKLKTVKVRSYSCKDVISVKSHYRLK